MATKTEITEANEHALRALDAVLQINPKPSLHEWAVEAGRSYGSILHNRTCLEEAGYIERVPGQNRSVRITPRGRRHLRGIARA